MKRNLLTLLAVSFFSLSFSINAATYKETGGIVVIEAEHFDVRTTNTDGHRWQIMPDENGNPNTAADAGYSMARGDKYVQSLPDAAGGGVAYNTGAAQVGIDPHLDFKVQISNPGIYRLWVRWGGYDGSSDSLFVQILEMKSPTGPGPDWYRLVGNNAGTFGAWSGSGAPSTDTVNNNSAGGGEIPSVWTLSAGTYTIRFGMREDGSAIDALILQLQSLPDPTNPGPPESVTTTAADTVPPTIVDARTAGNPNGVLVVFSEAVSPASATNRNNYAIDNGVTVNSVSLGQNNFSVVVNSTAIAPGRAYNLTVNGVQDQGGNSVAANTRVPFYQVDGVIERRVFQVSGGNIAAITNSTKFVQNLPDQVTYPTSIEGPVNYLDNYGTHFRGYVTAPTTGDYIFFICSDDPSALYLSTDENPANKKLIARETVWSDTRRWQSSGSTSDLTAKRSDQFANSEWPTPNKITLTAGRRYYIEALQAEGTGGDNVAVTWVLPGGAEPVDGDPPIPGNYLSAFGITPGPVTVSAQPSSQTVVELLSATFTATPNGSPPYAFQWFRNGTAIANATSQSYTIARTVSTDNGARFSVRISNAFSTVTSSEATLSVTVDRTAPELLGAKGNPNQTEVVLTYSEPVNPGTATNAANYAISSTSGSLNVTAAVLSTDATRVTLTTAKQTLGTKYIVTVNRVTDAAATPNMIVADSKAGFFPAGKIVELNGFIVFEAENFDRNLDGRWVRDTARAPTSGGAAMVVPNGGGGSEAATKLEYDIEFKQAATYIIWYRASGIDGADDSAWFHIDGARPAERANANDAAMTGFGTQLDYVWRADSFDGIDPMSVDIGAPGVHVVGLATREDGSFFDKFILTTDTAFTPTGFGPAETREGVPPSPTITLTAPTAGQTFAKGANITFSVNASGATGISVARVEFLANGNKVGESKIAPFSFTWNGTPDGIYSTTARVIDEVGGSTLSAPVQITVGSPPPLAVYFNGATPSASDAAAIARLKALGFDVKQIGAPNSQTSDAAGASLLVISSTVASGDIGTKFTATAVPILNWEASVYDELGIEANNVNGAAATAQTDLEIVDATHPLAAGLTAGIKTVYSTASDMATLTDLVPSAKVVARLTDGQPAIIAIERGAALNPARIATAPARRVGFFFVDNGYLSSNADGLKLFDAAVKWAANITVAPPTQTPTLSFARTATGLTVTFTGTLQSANAVTGPWTDVVSAISPLPVTLSGAQRFYRAKQ